MAFNFTPGQERAIKARGHSVLVSAAAGSGKTRVLTERLMSYVTDKDNPHDIDKFLIITYTRAAAAELKARIIEELGKRAAENPLDANLRRQQNLCYHAQIGTIHSFCTEIIRNNCHLLGISPAFTVMDEDRAQTMKSTILEKLLEERYERIEDDSEFALLADTVGAGRDDSRLVQIVLSLHGKMLSHAYPDEWAAQQIAALDIPDDADVAETPWGCEVIASVRAAAEYHAEALDKAAQEILSHDEKIAKAYYQTFADDALAARDFVRALDEGWDSARAFIPEKFVSLKALRAYDDVAFQDRVKAVREAYKTAMKGFSETFAQSCAENIADIRRMAPAARALLTLVIDFDNAFTAEKKRRALMDFSDLEHYACKLLVDRATGAYTWAANDLSQRYTEIMVDEYQDVNAVQEMIFRAVSRQGQNMFMVGDVKQSIYRFRLADPTIFLGKYDQFSLGDSGELILLQENFRSRKCVLDAANSVFGSIMSRELGELDYDEEAQLHFGSLAYPEGTDKKCEFVIIDSATGDEDTPDKAETEARYIAERINEMMASREPVYENGVGRSCRYSDFVLLMRSPSSKGGIFHRVLAEHGIPVDSNLLGGFFESSEVTTAINLLTVIDNPHADVALIAVLRSPLFSFTPDELSNIRAADKKADFYSALCRAAENGDEKCGAFLRFLTGLREVSADLSLDALIWKIFSETDLFALCSALPDGDRRREHLVSLFEYAAKFEQTGNRGLFRFVRWLRRAAERGEQPQSASGSSDCVKIMTIHKSKGLEFPFVFLCDTAHQFNMSDLHENVIMHSELGVGMKVTDSVRGIEYPTLARRAIESRLKKESLSEEMRVTYVAMTRAKERLIMTAVWDKAEEKYEKLTNGISAPVSPTVLLGCTHLSKWLALAAAADGGNTIDTKIIGAVGTLIPDNTGDATECAAIDCSAEYDAIRANLDFSYPYVGSVSLPSKVTATELKGVSDEKDNREDSAELVKTHYPRRFRKPDFSAETTVSAAQRGTATHTLMQHIDFGKVGTADSIAGEISRLVTECRLTGQEAESISAEAVHAFFASEIGQAMLGADEVKREFRFTLLVEASDHFSYASDGDTMLLQGVIDCFFIKNGEITVVDYKTDRITSSQISERAESYRAQLSAYAQAISRITKLPVRKKLLYFLVPGEFFEI
ncbi:MAG: helicase-exonuclease AddAB subunit AddA [Oscillospiraceae bacterium]|nr:helicase-exonuclease AddAB subunit AddA [Oscillospiraceae bacterium]